MNEGVAKKFTFEDVTMTAHEPPAGSRTGYSDDKFVRCTIFLMNFKFQFITAAFNKFTTT